MLDPGSARRQVVLLLGATATLTVTTKVAAVVVLHRGLATVGIVTVVVAEAIIVTEETLTMEVAIPTAAAHPHPLELPLGITPLPHRPLIPVGSLAMAHTAVLLEWPALPLACLPRLRVLLRVCLAVSTRLSNSMLTPLHRLPLRRERRLLLRPWMSPRRRLLVLDHLEEADDDIRQGEHY